ncbi:MAG: META domain-containing protein [Rhodobacterales bacterium]|nr:META domain-containing protein [Rhodobacterales bacterium]MDX5414457.1 META domain-containing protein [Rhodobacterales bacterium]
MFRAAAVLALSVLAVPVQARPVEGTLTYLARVALPAGAEVVIEARGLQDTLLAETRFQTGGKQVPLSFAMTLPDGVRATLRAAVVVDGQPLWVSDAMTVTAGDAPVRLGEVVLHSFQPMGFASTLRCGDARLRVGFFEDRAVLETDSDRLILSQVPAASGAKFEDPADPGTFYWSRGDTALVSLQGEQLPECVAVPPEPDQPYRARGTEPFWSLTIAGGQVELIPNIGMAPVRARLPRAGLDGADFVFDMAGAGIVLRLSETICHDLMAGTPYPQTVSVTWKEGALQGCGGEPIDLLAGVEWVVEDIDNAGIVDSSRVTLEFDAASRRVAGRGGCNRYNSAFDLSGEGLSIGPAAATRMACAPALMEQEQRFFALMSRISRFDIDPTGALLLYSNDQQEPLLKARIAD